MPAHIGSISLADDGRLIVAMRSGVHLFEPASNELQFLVHPEPDLVMNRLNDGKVGPDGVFYADQIMAKHDENYMPPEAARALDQAKDMEKIKNSANEAGRTLSNK